MTGRKGEPMGKSVYKQLFQSMKSIPTWDGTRTSSSPSSSRMLNLRSRSQFASLWTSFWRNCSSRTFTRAGSLRDLIKACCSTWPAISLDPEASMSVSRFSDWMIFCEPAAPVAKTCRIWSIDAAVNAELKGRLALPFFFISPPSIFHAPIR
jgi:hypothetical protein